ncbi:nucleoside 2-deoxyribosyltransferase [Candidatus Kaiserbacteria bacterium]|nr:nucleoside 2-deoxyribosyltransferase [Candidatus Kaiserbacteria bacterium]
MKSVAICGSRRFKQEIRAFAKRLKDLGAVVHEPYLYDNEAKHLSSDEKKFVALGLTHDHFYKIRVADVVFVYNKDRYCGNSTTLEIGFAVASGKPLYALSEDDEICRHVLFREVLATPEEFMKRL